MCMVNVSARPSTGRVDAYLGGRLRRLREERGYTQQQVAVSMAGEDPRWRWTPATVASIETGRRNISLDELAALCQIFGVGLTQLVGRPEDLTEAGTVARLRVRLDGLLGLSGPPAIMTTEEVAEATRFEKLAAVERAVLEGISQWVPSDPEQPEEADILVTEMLRSHYGRDLLDERDARVAAGLGNPTWVTRRLVSEVAELFESGKLGIVAGGRTVSYRVVRGGRKNARQHRQTETEREAWPEA